AWGALRDWGAVHERLAPGFLSDARVDGRDRVVTFFNGSVVRELFVGADDRARRLAWAVAVGGLTRSGPDGALYSPEFFQTDSGEVAAFIPVAGELRQARHPLQLLDLPGAELAVAVHRGPFNDLDKTYGALGGFVAERAIGVDGPIRENYLVPPYGTADEARHQTEVCWPVFLTAARSSG